MGVAGRLPCLFAGIGCRLGAAGQVLWGGVSLCVLSEELCVLGGWVASPGESGEIGALFCARRVLF